MPPLLLAITWPPRILTQSENRVNCIFLLKLWSKEIELISLADMKQEVRDEYLVWASAKICRGAGLDMPDDVASNYMLLSEKQPGYQHDLLDTVFNCLAFILFPRELGDKERQAMQEVMAIDCEDEEVTNAIVMQLITYSKCAIMGKVPKVK